jgi:hypothetical protein
MIGKSIILCATDVAGARNLSPLLPILADLDCNVCVLTTNERRDIFEPYLAFIDNLDIRKNFGSSELSQLIREADPVVVIAGTTRYKSMDRELIFQANQMGVRSVVLVDEWYAYRERFVDPDTGELKYLPDVICVPDQISWDEAVNSGLPGEKCCITGSVALADLTEKASGYLEVAPKIPEEVSSRNGKRVVTFLSETYVRDFGSAPGDSGLLGDYKGYSEILVVEDIWRTLQSISEPTLLIEKIHPADMAKSLGIQDQSQRHSWLRVKDVDLMALLWNSDAVIGMQSMSILEAYIMGCCVVSYQPGLIGSDTCTAVRLGYVELLIDHSKLKRWLEKILVRGFKRKIQFLPFADSGTKMKVLEIALSGMKNAH